MSETETETTVTEAVKDAPPKVDAIMFRVGWRPKGFNEGSPAWAQLEFADQLIGRKCETRTGDPWNFIAPIVLAGQQHHTILYPTGHPLDKTPRYDWVVISEGLQYGTLKPENL